MPRKLYSPRRWTALDADDLLGGLDRLDRCKRARVDRAAWQLSRQFWGMGYNTALEILAAVGLAMEGISVEEYVEEVTGGPAESLPDRY